MNKLDFTISDIPVLQFDINHDERTARLRNKPKEMAAKVILQPNERTYTGIENRLNFYMNAERTLKESMEYIAENCFYAPMQHNLNVKVGDRNDA